MKILGISGGRPNSNNDNMCREALAGAQMALKQTPEYKEKLKRYKSIATAMKPEKTA